jgi:GxxExxY protein
MNPNDLSFNHNPNSIKGEYKDSELTSNIIGCAMRVHSALGNGFQEVIYQRALALEFQVAGIFFLREFEMPIFYRSQQIGKRRVDFLVEKRLSVELKATTKVEDVHLAQAINYLEAYNLEIGLLINFGERSLNFKRFTNKKWKPDGSGEYLKHEEV